MVRCLGRLSLLWIHSRHNFNDKTGRELGALQQTLGIMLAMHTSRCMLHNTMMAKRHIPAATAFIHGMKQQCSASINLLSLLLHILLIQLKILLQQHSIFLYKSNTYVDSIYFADSLARITTGSNSSTAYYSSLWSNVGGFTKQQIQNAAQMYGSYLYTAWLNAGSPTLPLITSVNPPATSPEFFALDQNYPNPFNPSTVIHYTLSSPSMISLRVYDVTGRQVAVLSNGIFSTGSYTTPFNANAIGLATGIYFYRLDAVNIATGMQSSSTKKLLFMK